MFDDSLDPSGPSAEHSGTLGTNGRPVELRPRGSGGQSSRSIRRQTWNRDDVSPSIVIKQFSIHNIYSHSAYRAIPTFEFWMLFLSKSLSQVTVGRT